MTVIEASQMFDNEKASFNKIQIESEKIGKKNKNIVIVSPTGSGKTEASYLASKNFKNKRTIYGLPMKTLASSLNERLNRYECNINTEEKWSLQHSSAKEDANLSSNLSVTTIDQILSGYLGFGRESFIRGKNVLKSNIILDEIQLFDPEKSLLSLIELLNVTTRPPFDNRFCVMSATFPSVLIDFFKEKYESEIIVEEEEPNKKVILDYTESLPVEKIKKERNKQIILCNTQKQQVEVYERLKELGVEDSRLIVLNSRLFPRDREKAEKEAAKYFGKGSSENNKILLSTQVIEAGLDISSNFFYSFEAPIDSLIQREGRCARWGGTGMFVVVKEDVHTGVYLKEIVDKTSFIVKSNKGQYFSWKNKRKWVDDVLNPLYREILENKHKQRAFMKTLDRGSSKSLIRDIQSVNVIFSKTNTVEDFSKESISIPYYWVSNQSGHMKEKNEIRYKNPDIGETIIYSGSGWIYDACGVRKGESDILPESKQYELENIEEFGDYVEETFFEHASATEQAMSELLKSDDLFDDEQYKRWAKFIGAAHDVGKLTENWQKYIHSTEVLNKENYSGNLAHRPWEPRPSNWVNGVKHSLVGPLVLFEQLTRLERNVVYSHHGRLYRGENYLTSEFTLVSSVNEELQNIGLEAVSEKYSSYCIPKKEIISPINKEWGKLVYLTGVLMESDRLAIKRMTQKKKNKGNVGCSVDNSSK